MGAGPAVAWAWAWALLHSLQPSRGSGGLPKGSQGPRCPPPGCGTALCFLQRRGFSFRAREGVSKNPGRPLWQRPRVQAARVPLAGLQEVTVFEASDGWLILCEDMPFSPWARLLCVVGSAWVLTPLPEGPCSGDMRSRRASPWQHPSCAHVFMLPFRIFMK